MAMEIIIFDGKTHYLNSNPPLSLRKSVINLGRKSGTSRQGTPVPGSCPETLDGAAPAIPQDIMAKPNAVIKHRQSGAPLLALRLGVRDLRSPHVEPIEERRDP